MKVVLVGANGQLGRCLQDVFPDNWEVFCFNSSELDITRFESVQDIITISPDVIINTAAYTKVDLAETEVEAAFAVNATGVYHLAKAARDINARLIHISTDYVFNGQKRTPYRETDAACPINVYGQSKLAGENLALAAHTNTLVLRASWFYSEYGSNFLKKMLSIGRENNCLNVVHDQIGVPTYARDVATAIIHIILDHEYLRGVINVAGSDICSWVQFSEKIFSIVREVDQQYTVPSINAINTADYQNNAPRPMYSVLDTSVLRNTGITMNTLTNNIRRCIIFLKETIPKDSN